MSKIKKQDHLEEEFKRFYNSLPEASKTYLDENLEHMNFEAFQAYFTGFMHARKQVIEIVEAYTKRVDAILNKY